MKKLLSLLLALTMILPLVGCAAFAENADPIMITVFATSDVLRKRTSFWWMAAIPCRALP